MHECTHLCTHIVMYTACTPYICHTYSTYTQYTCIVTEMESCAQHIHTLMYSTLVHMHTNEKTLSMSTHTHTHMYIARKVYSKLVLVSATLQRCYNLAHIARAHALRTCIVTCHTPTYCIFAHTNTSTPHTHGLVQLAGFLFLTLFSQIEHVHECTHLCACTHTHTHTHTYTHTHTLTHTGLYHLQ